MTAEALHADPDGACFGFSPTSGADLRLLRRGDGDPLLISVRPADGARTAPEAPPLLRWTLPGIEPTAVSLHQLDRRFGLWIEGGGWFEVDPAVPAIEVPAGVDPVRREERMWGLPALLCFWARGDVAIHAAAVEIDGGAVLLAAPGHFGKTTLAAACLAAGLRVLSEDLACCRLGAEALVLPGPALLKVRRDSYERLDLGHVTVLAEDADRVHLAIDDDARGSAAPVPLRAVVLLGDVSEAPRLDLVDPVAAIKELWILAFNLPTDDGRARCFDDLTRLSEAVPIWRLSRPFSFAELPRVVAYLGEAFGG